MEHLEKAGLGGSEGTQFSLIEEKSYECLPRLVNEKQIVDLIFIDGMHTFDYTLVDFFYGDLIGGDKLCVDLMTEHADKFLDDIQKLLALEEKGVFGAITGRAIYEGKLDLKEALALCSQNG